MLKQINTISMALTVIASATNAYAIGPAGMARDISRSSIVIEAKMSYGAKTERFEGAVGSSDGQDFNLYCVGSARAEMQRLNIASFLVL
jgi:hypothetical protein